MGKTPINPEKPWTALKMAKLRKYINNNLPVSLMAYFLGMSQGSIRDKAETEHLSLKFIDEMEFSG